MIGALLSDAGVIVPQVDLALVAFHCGALFVPNRRDVEENVGLPAHLLCLVRLKKVKVRCAQHFLARVMPNVWRRFRQAVPELRTEGKKVTLTEKKSISVTRFKNSLFTTLTTQTAVQPYHINLGDGHWGALLQVLPKIDAMIAPGPIIDCSDCNNALQVVSLCQGKLKKTLLSDEEL